MNEKTLAALEGIFFDCDGVLTPGDLFYDEAGRRLLRFNSKDGFGLAMAARVGLKLAVISGRATDIAEKRFAELGFGAFVGPCKDKKAAFLSTCAKLGIDPARTAFVGDDVPDLAAFAVAGCKIAVADAVSEIKRAADWVTQARGGHGAAREICEAVLKARGDWNFT